MDNPTISGDENMKRKTKIITLILILALTIPVTVVIAWQYLIEPENTPSAPLSITDDYGRNVTITEYPERIVSLAPTCTYIIFGLNLENKLVGVDSFEYYPPEIKETINERSITTVGEYAYISSEAILALEPDLVIAAMRTQAPIIENLGAVGVTALLLDPRSFADVLADISLIGEATGQTEEAATFVASIQERAQIVADKTQDVPKPRVYVEYSFNGAYQTFGSGSFMDELVAKAGGINVFTNSSNPYIGVSSEEVIICNPEVIIISKGSMSEACGLSPETIINRPGWNEITAVKNNQIYEIDENTLMPHPAMINGLETIAKLLHPELFE
jgi:iron complex transport system substrate-binding protein